MNYCGPRGIAWDRFLSWPKISRDAAILWQQLQDQTCSGCGTRPDEWDPKAGGHLRAYVATTHVCHGCAAIENRRERDSKQESVPGEAYVLRRQATGG